MPNRKQRTPPVVNITPLVDVLIILVVVLLLAIPLSVKRLPVELPQTSLAGVPTPIIAMPIALTKDSTLYLEGTAQPLESILALIRPTSTIELSVDKEVTYEVIARVLASLQKKQPKEIVLLTR